MGFLDKLKSTLSQGDDYEDELDADAAPDDDDGDGEDESDSSSGGGALGRAAGLLSRVKKLSSGGEGDEGGGIGALLGKAKGFVGAKMNSGNSDPDDDDGDDDTNLDDRDLQDADQDDQDGEQPIRRSGIAAALDGGSGAAASTEEEDEEPEIPVAVGSAAAAIDLNSLFEEEFVTDPTLKDLAESLDEVSAVDLAADLRSFLEELQ